MASRASLALLFAAALAAQAQGVVSARAGLVNHVQGVVFVNDQPVVPNGDRLPQLKDGDTLTTEAGRAEFLMGPGVIIRIAESSCVRMLDTARSNPHVEISEGTALIEVISQVPDSRVQVSYKDAAVDFRKAGLYRLEASMGELDVYQGEARVARGDRKASVKRGDAVQLREQLGKSKFDPKQRTDSVHEWAARRSFLLYVSDPEARRLQRNWTEIALGWVWNPSYGRRYYSQQVADESLQRAMREAQQQGEFARIQQRLQQVSDNTAAAAERDDSADEQ